MKADIETSAGVSPATEFGVAGSGRSEDDFRTRERLAKRIDALMGERGWSKAEIARRSGIGHGTFSQWQSKTYGGRYDTVNTKIEAFLGTIEAVDGVTASLPEAPSFLDLGNAGEIIDMLTIAQVMPTMVMVTAEAGMGKSTVARHYRDTRANAHLVTISPYTKSIHNMLNEIAQAIGVEQPSPAKLLHTIGKRLERTGAGTLLIIDEAQNLADEAINQLRHFVDIYGCGVALLGNSETYARFARWGHGERFGQLRRRIFKRLKREKPTAKDLAAFIDAWGITDPKMVEFLTGVGMKPGALGQVDMTIKLACMVAQGAGRELNLSDLKSAWSNRDVETA